MEVEELQGLLSDRDTEILNLKEQLKTASKASSDVSAPTKHRETANQVREQSSFITNKIELYWSHAQDTGCKWNGEILTCKLSSTVQYT